MKSLDENTQPAIMQPHSPQHNNAHDHAHDHGHSHGHGEHSSTAHPLNDSMALEHDRLLNLLPQDQASHVATRSGNWSNSEIWKNGQLPDAGATVLIPSGVEVNYDVPHDTTIFGLRIDGILAFSRETDTTLNIDTIVVSPTGTLDIGSLCSPIPSTTNINITFSNNGDIDVGWDPGLLSRGLISHGSVSIHGANKTTFLKVAAPPMAGAERIELEESPQGWRVGDQIVITGTHKLGWLHNQATREIEYHGTQDEVRTVKSIEGSTIILDRPLAYDHDTPRVDLSAYVANLSRNITFESEGGAETPAHQRGHVMFMHNDDVDVRYAAFNHLGRTDKASPAFDLSAVDSVYSDTNVKGRYSFHFHKTGTEDQLNPAMALGNSITGSLGWGYVHHSAHAHFIENVAYDVFGAAFNAEDGDETGIWLRNIAIKSEGISPIPAAVKAPEDVARHDNGRTGDGFFFAGRLVESVENVAANTTNGFVWMNRSAPAVPRSEQLEFPLAMYGAEHPFHLNFTALEGFRNNEVFGASNALIINKSNPEMRNEVRSNIDGLLAWEVATGVAIDYIAHYTFRDLDLIGARNTAHLEVGRTIGIDVFFNTFDIVVVDSSVANFNMGARINNGLSNGGNRKDTAHHFVNVSFAENVTDFQGFDADTNFILESSGLLDGGLRFEFRAPAAVKSLSDRILLDGIKWDSIGERERQFDNNIQKTPPIGTMLLKQGFYEDVDGLAVFLLRDIIFDRVTSEPLKLTHKIPLGLTAEELVAAGYTFNGTIGADDSGRAVDDVGIVHSAGEVLLDLLGGVAAKRAGDINFAGASSPSNGNVFDLGGGEVLYRPKPGFAGEDSFFFWIIGGDGQYLRGEVKVLVHSAAEQGCSHDDATPTFAGVNGVIRFPLHDEGGGTTLYFTPNGGERVWVDVDPYGLFSVSSDLGERGHLDALRDVGDSAARIGSGSALEALRIAVGLSPSWGPAGPMDFIAADFNRDGKVTTADALEILRFSIGQDTDASPQWLFIDSEADLSSVTRMSTHVPTGVVVEPAIDTCCAVSLIGILVGDLSGHQVYAL